VSSVYDLVYCKENLLYKIKHLPIWIRKSKKGKLYPIHLNGFTNYNNRFTQNTLKQKYKYSVNLPPKPDKPYTGVVTCLVVYHRPNNRRSDVHNMCTMIAKFVLDILVNEGYLEDDNYKYLTDIHFTISSKIGSPLKHGHADLYIFKKGALPNA